MMDATAPTPLLEIQQAVVTRDGQAILKIPQLGLERGEVLAVIGPNGAGKSTLLLTISQLLPLSAGRLLLNGGQITPAQSLAYRRRLALVLQEPLLLNTSVFENIATGLHFRGVPRAEIQHTVQHWLNRLGITHLKNRPARKLSGGEAQRVSLARALALQPDLLLLDEPFSALDTPTRLQLHQDLAQLLGETHTTAIFVTHDMDEALYLGTRVAIIIRGELRQVGSPEEVFTAPKDPEVAQFVGVETVFPGRVISQEEGLITAEVNGLLVQAVSTAAVGRTLMFCLRPEDITLSPLEPAAANSARNRMTGRIARLTASGALLRVELEGAVRMVALITRSSAREMGLSEGQLISAAFKASAVHTIEKI